ncbi:hypothetical protein GCM10022281_18560 [Sphingomonas rosea]|uniref:BD-FAE-like domain-containing protein n=1 Tax=Sphingomonas rosea TaxID=335605 RepID=A0ABP7U8Y2_9SPHN
MFAPNSGQRIDFDLAYKTAGERDLHLDIFRPAPALNRGQGLLLVHGGAWRSGSKAHFYALANRLARRGYTVFLPEYRLAPEAPYPAGMRDVADALAWAQGNAKHYGLKPSRIAIGGASSGGQMAALLAYRGTDAYGAGKAVPNALVDLDGVLDMTTPFALGFENAAGPASPFAQWLGGSFEQVPQRWREASAATYVGAASPPTLVIASSAPRFTAGREAVLAALKAKGIRTDSYTFARSPHDLWLFEPYLGVAVERIDRFLRAVAADEARKGRK